MVYISLVGTQVMAVLNPLLVLMEQNKKPDKVELLATQKSCPNAKDIKQFLIDSKQYSANNIDITKISRSNEADKEGKAPAHEAVKTKISDLDHFFFNVAGGMNFQIAACIYEINPEKCLFLYPESQGIYAISLRKGKIEHAIYNLPKPIDVLKIQGTKYEIIGGAQDHEFLTFAKNKCGVNLPNNAIRHLQISNVVFDLAWNTGNELKFLKVIHSSQEYNKKDAYYLREARKVINLALNREQFGELYHRKIAILTNHPLVAERIRDEGAGKIVIIDSTAENAFCNIMRNFLIDLRAESVRGSGISSDTGNSSNNDSILYVPLGKDITPTLITLWSHKPHTVNFLYTPNDSTIICYKDAIFKNKKLLPVTSVSFYPVSIAGHEILDIPSLAGSKIEINITPGTKGQTAFLSLWAKAHSAKIFSIETNERMLRQIPHGTTKAAYAPPLLMYLKLSGVKVKHGGENKPSLLKDSNLFDGIINFLEAALSEFESLKGFPNTAVSLQEMKFNPINDKAVITFNSSNKRKLQWSLKNNEWFEKLIGYILSKCGADDVRVRIRTGWSETTESYLQGKYGKSPHKTDIDVAACFKTNYYVVSCKSGKKDDEGKITTEISAVSSLFGRFAIPLVAYLQYEGEPYKHNGVYIFGFKTFLNTEKMKSLIDIAIKEKQSRNQP